MKKKVFLLLLITLGISNIVMSQYEFQKGYILKSPRDTVYGFIENRNYYDNSIKCNFKIDKNAQVQKFRPNDIYGYRFENGKFYVSKDFVNKDSSISKFFFEYLINGNLNVYFRQGDSQDNHYFIQKDTLTLRELEYRKSIEYVDNTPILLESKSHNALLSYYTMDCPSVKKDAMKIKEPTSENLIKFATKYHNMVCKDHSCIVL